MAADDVFTEDVCGVAGPPVLVGAGLVVTVAAVAPAAAPASTSNGGSSSDGGRCRGRGARSGCGRSGCGEVVDGGHCTCYKRKARDMSGRRVLRISFAGIFRDRANDRGWREKAR